MTEDFTNVENPMREADVLLSTCAWSLMSTASTVTDKIPGQLHFKADMTMQIEMDPNWNELIKRKEKNLQNDELENSKSITHQYQVG